MSVCRSCRAPVVWAETPGGARQPFDREPNPNGNRVLLGRGPDRPPLALVYSLLPEDSLGGALYDLLRREARYMPHHKTCPHAEQWKGKGSSGPKSKD